MKSKKPPGWDGCLTARLIRTMSGETLSNVGRYPFTGIPQRNSVIKINYGRRDFCEILYFPPTIPALTYFALGCGRAFTNNYLRLR